MYECINDKIFLLLVPPWGNFQHYSSKADIKKSKAEVKKQTMTSQQAVKVSTVDVHYNAEW